MLNDSEGGSLRAKGWKEGLYLFVSFAFCTAGDGGVGVVESLKKGGRKILTTDGWKVGWRVESPGGQRPRCEAITETLCSFGI